MKIWHSGRGSQIKLSAQEICDISREISSSFAPEHATFLPELVLLPVDPFHMYAYWNLGEPQVTHSLTNASDHRLILRIYWRPDENRDVTKTKLWFDLPICGNRNQKKIPLPIDKTAYSAAIGIRRSDNRFDVLAYSNTVHVPRGNVAPFTQRQDTAESVPQSVEAPVQRFETSSTESCPDNTDVNHQDIDVRYENIFADAVFSSPLMDILPERSFDEHLIHKKTSPEKSHYASSNASGQINNR